MAGLKTRLAGGGGYSTEELNKRPGFDCPYSAELEIVGGERTGDVIGPNRGELERSAPA